MFFLRPEFLLIPAVNVNIQKWKVTGRLSSLVWFRLRCDPGYSILDARYCNSANSDFSVIHRVSRIEYLLGQRSVAGYKVPATGDQQPETREQKADDRGQRTEGRGQRTENDPQVSVFRFQDSIIEELRN